MPLSAASIANAASNSPENPSSAPVMIIRDLATDMGMMSPDTESPDAVLDTLVNPDLQLVLLTKYDRTLLS